MAGAAFGDDALWVTEEGGGALRVRGELYETVEGGGGS